MIPFQSNFLRLRVQLEMSSLVSSAECNVQCIKLEDVGSFMKFQQISEDLIRSQISSDL